MNILVTGGTGYIDSHTLISLRASNHTVVVVDHLSNSKRTVIQRIKEITHSNIIFYECDIRDHTAIDCIFFTHKIDAVIHFAGLKAVAEPVEHPLYIKIIMCMEPAFC